MHVLVSFIAVGVLFLAGILGPQAGLEGVLGIVVPYLCVALFLGGLSYRVLRWAASPVPFRIPTTCGQQKSLPWIKQNKLDNPDNAWGVAGRIALEVLLFRSLFRNTRTELLPDGRLVYSSRKFLWLGALVFHGAFLCILLRHLRFFTAPAPFFVPLLEDADGFLQLGLPVFYLSSFLFLAALTYLLARRLFEPQVRYISLASDYFPLFLLLGIGASGFYLRHFGRTDVVSVKEWAMGLVSFRPAAPRNVAPLFYGHLLLVCTLLACFPFSKLVHMAGVFLSPTRNLANNNRMRRHVNPWNYPVAVHTYAEYEDEFRDKMKAAGIPLEKS